MVHTNGCEERTIRASVNMCAGRRAAQRGMDDRERCYGTGLSGCEVIDWRLLVYLALEGKRGGGGRRGKRRQLTEATISNALCRK